MMGGCQAELIGDLVQILKLQNHDDFQEPGFFEVKSAKLQPYFFMCCQCLAMARPMSQRKQMRRKGQQTGTRKIQKQVQIQQAMAIRKRLFHRLNSLMDLRTGRSPSELLRIDMLYSRNMVLSASSSSGSGSPEGVQYWTTRQMTQSATMYIRPRYQYLNTRQRTQAQRKARQLHLSLFQRTDPSTTVCTFLSTSNSLLFIDRRLLSSTFCILYDLLYYQFLPMPSRQPTLLLNSTEGKGTLGDGWCMNNKIQIMIHFQTNQSKTRQQSLLSVFLQAIVYYDEILSYFVLVFQYLLFIYKYNILTYASGTIAVELILLTLLLILNPLRIGSGRVGNKGKKYLRLILFLILDVLFILGLVYIIALQSSALYVEIIIAIMAILFSGLDFILGLVLLIYYKCSE